MNIKKPDKVTDNDIQDVKIRFTEKIKNKYYRNALIFFLIAVILSILSINFTGYLKQAAVIVGILFYYISLKCFAKYNKTVAKTYFGKLFGGIIKFIHKAYQIIKAKTVEILKLKPRTSFMRGKDEKDIVIDHDTPGFIEQLLNLRNRPKWRDMHSNAERTRFLYIKFMVHLCKKGYKLFASDTSREISLVAPNYTNNKKEEVSLLFDNYELARYNSIDPDDATIELLKHIN